MPVKLRSATPRDFETVVLLSFALAREQGVPFTRTQERALKMLLAADRFGRVFLIEDGQERIGYAVLCWGFSIEFGGRDGLLDELYVVEERRGQGVGKTALRLIEEEAVAAGIVALHLKVLKDNNYAANYYRRRGYVGQRSLFLSKRL
jgi:ribosomal protein S18 acetylase RimI-like enzyme